MMNFESCQPDAQNRENAWRADLYSAGSFSGGVYTEPQLVGTIENHEILSAYDIEEYAPTARSQTVIESRGTDIVPFAFAAVYAASCQPGYVTPPYYQISRQRLLKTERRYTGGITETTLQSGIVDIDEIIETVYGRGGFFEAIEATYDEDDGDFTHENVKCYTMQHLMKALMWLAGLYPCSSGVTSDGVDSYNAALTNEQKYLYGYYFKNDATSRNALANGGLTAWLEWFNAGRSDAPSSTAPLLHVRERKNGDKLFYILSDNDGSPSKSYTADDYVYIEQNGDSVYGDTIEMTTRGDIRHEVDDLVEIDGFGFARIRRSELDYNGVLTGKLTLTMPVPSVPNAIMFAIPPTGPSSEE